MFQRFLSRPIYLAFAVAAIAFVIYLQTLAPSVDFIDAGELATVCTTLGIAHPTGYPLFTLVGWVFAHLPIGSTVIYRLNIMAAFFTALGAGVVMLLAGELFSFWVPERQKRPAGQKNKGKAKSSKEKRVVARSSRPTKEAPAQVTEEGLANRPLQLAAAAATGLAMAFSATWWAQSCSIEVYPLHLFLMPLVLVFFLRMLRREEVDKVGGDGRLFALILGLSFTNHMTTILLAPACLYMFFARYRFSKLSWRRILRLAPFFILGLLIYLYLPIRSAMYPLMDWGHPTTIGAFLRHVSAKQFQIWMYTGTGAAGKQWTYFWSRVPKEFTIVGLVFALLGIWKMYMSAGVRRTHILIFTLLLFFGCLLYSINYDIHDIDSYFLLAFLAMALWIGAGVDMLSRLIISAKHGPLFYYIRCLKKYANFKGRASRAEFWSFLLWVLVISSLIRFLFKSDLIGDIFWYANLIPSYAVSVRRLHDAGYKGIWAHIAAILTFILALQKGQSEENQYGPNPLNSGEISTPTKYSLLYKRLAIAFLIILIGSLEVILNFSSNNESGNYMVEDYTKNVLENLPPNAIIFSTQWDFFVSGAFYYQLVERVRPDVLVIDKAMLRDRPWYYAELEKRAPEVFARVKPEEEAFLQYLNAFVEDKPFDQAAIAPAYQQFTSALVERNMDRPIFVTQEMVEQPDELFAPKMKPVPAGIAYRLVPRDTMFEVAPPKLIWNDKHYRLRDYYTDELRTLQAMPLASYGHLEMQRGNYPVAKQFFDAALTFTPDLGANLDDLSERDRGVAETTNEQFERIHRARASLGK